MGNASSCQLHLKQSVTIQRNQEKNMKFVIVFAFLFAGIYADPLADAINNLDCTKVVALFPQLGSQLQPLFTLVDTISKAVWFENSFCDLNKFLIQIFFIALCRCKWWTNWWPMCRAHIDIDNHFEYHPGDWSPNRIHFELRWSSRISAHDYFNVEHSKSIDRGIQWVDSQRPSSIWQSCVAGFALLIQFVFFV